MALEGAEWGAIAGVFVIVFAMMVYNQMVAKRNAAAPTTTSGGSGTDAGQYLSRFVVHQGDVVGEAVAIDEGSLIVKHQGAFRAVPLAMAQVANGEVHLRGDLDWEQAAEQGQEWLVRNRKGQDDQVTSHLTTSDDVRRPAYQAFQERRREAAGDLPDDSEEEE